MEIAVVDDNRTDQKELTELMHRFGADNHCLFNLVAFSNAGDFLKALDQTRFAIVFMDVYMEGISGITAAAKLREIDKNCLLIFLTSSTEFMPDAFACHAFEYITKPIAPERIFTVLQDAMEILDLVPKYIELVSGRRTVTVFLKDIVSAITDAHYLNIGLTNGSVVRIRMTMQSFLGMLGCDPRFVTVNKGIVLNADCVTEIENNCCVMESGMRFPIRVRDRVQVEQAVRSYHFAKIRNSQRHGS